MFPKIFLISEGGSCFPNQRLKVSPSGLAASTAASLTRSVHSTKPWWIFFPGAFWSSSLGAQLSHLNSFVSASPYGQPDGSAWSSLAITEAGLKPLVSRPSLDNKETYWWTGFARADTENVSTMSNDKGLICIVGKRPTKRSEKIKQNQGSVENRQMKQRIPTE